ncbi:thiamine pyrophosphate-binding protein [Microbaculum marinum]|uniref:Thiamine pyrophosphate-binding protein n=1 Tax=Microbaculum marinum TaxID=1764581 RepID=A0AAW9RD23_9HYPH
MDEKNLGVGAETGHEPRNSNARLFGSDPIAEVLRALEFDYIALTPGASFRGLHDSLVNHLGNTRPEMLLCVHEEHAVALAHGYTRVTGRPLAVALHSNVGLMHATMAIFNAWCDRIPILMLGAVGPVDAVNRRPWVDWIHTSSDLGALIRGYTKWDDQPGSVTAAVESVLRAYRIAVTEPRGPTYVCLDAGWQEKALDGPLDLPDLQRFRAGTPGDPPAETLDKVAAALNGARNPVIMMGRVSRDPADWDRRVAFAEKLNATVLTDMKTGATFPTRHPLHPYPAGLFVTDAAAGPLREADVILSLDWVDLGGSLRQACGGKWPSATVISCSLDEYVHNGWSMDYQALPPADISILAPADRLVDLLVDRIDQKPAGSPARQPAKPAAPAADEDETEGMISINALAQAVVDGFDGENPCYIRLPIGWPGEYSRFDHPLDYVGYDGGGGIGSGPGMAVGGALALRDSGGDRLPVAVLGDGDYLMGVTALWTAVKYEIPLLVIVVNNQSFFNDELHQERVARVRGRPVENRWIGMRMSEPGMNLATMAEGQGAVGFGPVGSSEELSDAIAAAIEKVRGGAVAVIDVRVAPEYARSTSSAVVREMATTK